MFKWVAVALLLALCVLCAGMLARSPRFQIVGELMYRGATQEKVVALTFDDGPSPHNTRDLLKLLAAEKVVATFFVVGAAIETHREIALETLRAGHQLANHSYSHPRMLFQSVDFCRDQIVRTDRLIRELGYTGRTVFRPPMGNKVLSLPLALRELEKVSVTWDVNPKDTRTQDAALLKSRVLGEVGPGSIVVMHDGGARKDGTLAAVREIIPELKRQGYRFVTIDELRALK